MTRPLDTLQAAVNLSAVFQPVFGLLGETNPIYALRAALRGPSGSQFENSETLLQYVRRTQAEPFFDRACLALVCQAMRRLPMSIRVHVPVHLSTLTEGSAFVYHFIQQVEGEGLATDRFTVDLIESDGEWTEDAVKSLDELRELGVRVGLSEVGFANTSWRLLLERSPEFWSISPYLAEFVSDDVKKQAAVESILSLATRFGCLVIATGIQREEDLMALATLGVRFVLAEFLCPPISADALLRSGALMRSGA